MPASSRFGRSSGRHGTDPAAGLRKVLSADRVLDRPLDLIAHASDASLYRLIPQVVARPRSVPEIQELFRVSQSNGVPLVFRAAGTSLSGQAITDGILADLSRDWRTIEILDDGRRVRVEPGVIGGAVNRALQPFGARLGPDPASINACMMGGILANNSSGMCCGVSQNAYHTLESLTFVLPTGTIVDTADPEADQMLREREPALWGGLLAIQSDINAHPALRERIRAKYRTKNTTGYSLNAFVDFERPVDILQHLLIGSEGTLAFIASAVLRTVADPPVKLTGLLLFPGIREACAAILPLKDTGAAALEVMDRSALRSVEHQAGIPEEIAGLPAGATGLLMEHQCGDDDERSARTAQATAVLSRLALLRPPRLTRDAAERAALWKVRQGMFPSIGSMRPRATTVIIEDVAFPVERLADAVIDLTALFRTHDYPDAIIFGHAKDGNLHFVLSQSFGTAQAIAQYARFMDDVVALVTRRYDGALKAEHGTGRNMAPFVEAEWGADAWAIMRRLKALLDPAGLLNPGVIVNSDPRAHLEHLKSLPVVEDEIDQCIECGYCEAQCPSRDLTLTPRQRIVVRRELARLASAGTDAALRTALETDYGYAGLDTCAADGLCAVACPVGIDTGQLTKRLRQARHSWLAQAGAAFLARHFALVEHAARIGLAVVRLAQAGLGARVFTVCARIARAPTFGAAPAWIPPMPAPAPRGLPATDRAAAVAVYFPSCLSRTMGPLPGEPTDVTVPEALVAVARRAGQSVWIPDRVSGHCCGMPFSSKGYGRAHREMAARTVNALFEWSGGGRLPIVIDTSPCAQALKTCRDALEPADRAKIDRLVLLDSIEFISATVLPRLDIHRRARVVTLHPVCSVIRMELAGQFERVAAACSDEVFVPPSAGCCGFAGDRGWLRPELTASATAMEAQEVRARGEAACYSSSRTCEIGMMRATGHIYRSYLHLLEWASRPCR